MKVTVDREVCCGAGQCVLLAPEVFDQDEDDARVLLLAPSPGPADQAATEDAAAVCPTGAISIMR
ncbi:ferredoxin [Actinoplanes sp. OR16]|uniref:ferredoxin n=1 Tax=Actinoplanes sp. OR16 TaxID=946334 RepID=UPI000F6DC313|nr:ferredoxin [Actinoplanes sp. OR16]BBH67568.1 ferredoxin [Actinoplanes sp. OR16]